MNSEILKEIAREKEVIKESERRLRAILKHGPAAIVIVNSAGKIKYASNENEAIFGYSTNELQGQSAFKFIYPQDRAFVLKILRKALTSPQKPITSEYRVLHKDGTIRWIRATGKNMLSDPLVRGIVVNYIDITKRKRLEGATRELASIVENSNDAIIGKTLDGVITSWNRGAEKIYGYTAKEAVGKNIKFIAPKEKHSEIDELIERLKRGEKIEHLETTRVTKGGEKIDVSLNVSPIQDKNGNITGASAIARDITERKREQRNRDEYIAALSHELRNPLAPIMTNIELLKMQDIDNKITLKYIDTIDRQINNIKILLDDLLDIVRMTQGRIVLSKQSVDLRDIIQNSLETTGHLIEKYEHKIELKLPQKPLKAKVDPLRVEQILINLLINAVKYMKKQGTINISLSQDKGYALIRVSDTGMGITKKEMEDIFKIFVQGKQTLARSQGGLGIGLALVKKITELHGGEVRANSEGRGKGSEFTVMLPLK